MTSSELFVPCAGVYNLWTDYGAGPHFIVNWYENYGHSSTASAYSTQISTTDTPTVYVLTSPDGVNFTRANLPIVRSVITAPGGHPAVKYTAQIPSVTALRFYSFVMASNGTTGVCEPTFVGPNAWLGAITAKATVSASRAFTVSGSIKPHIAAGYKTVTLRCVRSGSSKTKFFTAMVYDSGAFSVYRASIKLPRGTWRIYPHVASGSKYGGVVGGWANAWGDSQQLIFKKVVVR
ncbi:MAG: hypothetical protein P4L93_09930 [Coriobacteriia bacterium]|nr:hypothetical protein [Coriobacteriia bacterium]